MISAGYDIDDEGLRLLANLEQHYADDEFRADLPEPLRRHLDEWQSRSRP